MIRFLENKNIDKKKWDECIDNSINSLIYAKSWYLDIVCPDWNCIEINNYKAVFPLPVKKKYNIRYIFPPYFIQQLGLFFTDENYNNEKIISEVINNIPSEYKLIHLYLNEHNKISPGKYDLEERKNFTLELNRKYESINRNYSHGLKDNLKAAVRNNIKLFNSTDIGLFLELYKKNTGKQLNKFKREDYKALGKLLAAAIKHNCAELKLIYYNSELLAGAVFLIHKKRIIYLLSSSTEKGKKMAAMPFLLDQMIMEYSNQPYIFDFEGSMVKSIAKFFKSFGSAESVYLHLKINRLPRLIRWLKE